MRSFLPMVLFGLASIAANAAHAASPPVAVAKSLAKAGAECQLQSAETAAVPAGYGPTSDMVFPYGINSFEFTNCPGSVEVIYYYPQVVEGMQLWKLLNGQWIRLTAENANLVIKGDTVTYTIADNGPFDADPQVGVISDPAGLAYVALPAAPGAPKSVNVTPSGDKEMTVSWAAPADGGGPAVRYVINVSPGSAGCLADAPGTSCTLTGLDPGNSYAFTVMAENAGGTSATVSATTTGSPRVSNLSTRGVVLSGDNVLIGGFAIGGTEPKKVLVTARGPSLAAQGVTGTLANPTLTLFSGSMPIAFNDDWGSAANAKDIAATGFGPTNSLESAVLVTLDPGPYTAIVSGASGATGIGIVETFEVDKPYSPLLNLAARAPVFTGDNVMVAGFIITGNIPRTVLVTARGPSLAAQGVSGLLADPVVTLYSGSTAIATNDDWQANANAAAIQATGKAPANAKEAALLLTLQPGAYTAVVSGAGNTTGIGIVEVFAQ